MKRKRTRRASARPTVANDVYRMAHRGQRVYLPTAEQIRERAAAIRAGWSEHTERERQAEPSGAVPWEVPVVAESRFFPENGGDLPANQY